MMNHSSPLRRLAVAASLAAASLLVAGHDRAWTQPVEQAERVAAAFMLASGRAPTRAETERWLAPVLNYIPSQEQTAKEPASVPVAAAVPANDVTSHPPGCTCAVHLAWRKKAVGA